MNLRPGINVIPSSGKRRPRLNRWRIRRIAAKREFFFGNASSINGSWLLSEELRDSGLILLELLDMNYPKSPFRFSVD